MIFVPFLLSLIVGIAALAVVLYTLLWIAYAIVLGFAALFRFLFSIRIDWER